MSRYGETVKADEKRWMIPPARQSVAQISKELSIQNAILLCFADFMDWYKSRHRHSGIKFVTPDQRHNGGAM
jgi:hypothetical protein